jgi:hypothetical protein
MRRVVLLLQDFAPNRPALVNLQNTLELAVSLHQDGMVFLESTMLDLHHFEDLAGKDVVRHVFVLSHYPIEQFRQAGHSFAQQAVCLARYFFHLSVFLL